MGQAVLVLGSNINNKNWHISEAIKRIRDKYKIIKISSRYFSEAWGFKSENDFINIAIIICCENTPFKLLKDISEIEKSFGRIRHDDQNYHDRTIDIDIMVFGDKVVKTQLLTIPHPRLHLRRFCLEPLSEILPLMKIPTHP